MKIRSELFCNVVLILASAWIISCGRSGDGGGSVVVSINSWKPMTSKDAPAARLTNTALWTGGEMIIWGGFIVDNGSVGFNTGGKYDPSTDSWRPTSTGENCPSQRLNAYGVWTGTEMIVWGGGLDDGFSVHVRYQDGGRYDPASDSWRTMSQANAPTARMTYNVVWTGFEMVIWSGEEEGNSFTNTGGRYNPYNDSWQPTSTANAPSPRLGSFALWTGEEMIVWGGFDGSLGILNTGGKYNSLSDSWDAMTTVNAPSEYLPAIAVWTGKDMVIWGGGTFNQFAEAGAKYNPEHDSWMTISASGNLLSPRTGCSAVWTGTEIIIWGGAYGDAQNNIYYYNDGAKYDPARDIWQTISNTNAPSARMGAGAVWTGKAMIIWGGMAGPYSDYLDTGSIYKP